MVQGKSFQNATLNQKFKMLRNWGYTDSIVKPQIVVKLLEDVDEVVDLVVHRLIAAADWEQLGGRGLLRMEQGDRIFGTLRPILAANAEVVDR